MLRKRAFRRKRTRGGGRGRRDCYYHNYYFEHGVETQLYSSTYDNWRRSYGGGGGKKKKNSVKKRLLREHSRSDDGTRSNTPRQQTVSIVCMYILL